MHLDQETNDYVSAQQLMLAIDPKITEELKQPRYDYALAQQLRNITTETFAQQLGEPNRGNLSVRHLMDVIAASIGKQVTESNRDSAQQLMKIITASVKKHLNQPIYDYFSAQKLIKIIAANIKEWPWQWERERSLHKIEPKWRLSDESLERINGLSSARPDRIWPDEFTGRIVICELLNSFPSKVFPHPREMHSSIKFGIRPLLYALLRRRLLNPRGSSICSNSECRNFFNTERAGQEFCSPECSLRHRQRIYWQERGKKLRKKRTAQRRKAGK